MLKKLSYTFDQLNETKNIDNLQVLLLEDDYYLFPDTIYTLRKLTEKASNDYNVISLGFNQRYKYVETYLAELYFISNWDSAYHNTGMVLNRLQWKMIKNCINVCIIKI